MSPECDTPLERLDLSVRTYVRLKRAEVDSVADLLALEVRDIARVFRGRKESLDELRRELAIRGRRFLLSEDECLFLAGLPVSALGVWPSVEDKLLSYGLGRVAALIETPRARLHRIIGRSTADAMMVKVWAYCVVRAADTDGAPVPAWLASWGTAHGSRPRSLQGSTLLRLCQADIARLPVLNRADEVLLAGKIAQVQESRRGAPRSDEAGAAKVEFERLREEARRARNQMVERTVAWVIQWAEDYGERGVDLTDLMQEGTMGVMRAADRFDHKAGGRFYVYAWWWANQAMTRVIQEQGRAVRLPTHVHERLVELEDALERLSSSSGREPCPRQVSVALGLLSDEDGLAIEHALNAGKTVPGHLRCRLDRALGKVTRLMGLAAPPLSFDASLEDVARADPSVRRFFDKAAASQTDWRGRCIGDLLPSDSLVDPLEGVAREQLRVQIGEALSSLGHRERLVLDLRYGLRDGKGRTLQEIGQVIGVTRERVRQIEAKGLKRLRHPRRSRGLTDYLH